MLDIHAQEISWWLCYPPPPRCCCAADSLILSWNGSSNKYIWQPNPCFHSSSFPPLAHTVGHLLTILHPLEICFRQGQAPIAFATFYHGPLFLLCALIIFPISESLLTSPALLGVILYSSWRRFFSHSSWRPWYKVSGTIQTLLTTTLTRIKTPQIH